MTSSPLHTISRKMAKILNRSGNYSAIEVLPDMLIDLRSGAVLSQGPIGGLPA